jgi:hypothetical protein
MVQDGFGAVNNRLQGVSDRLDALKEKAEERYIFLLSRLEQYPNGQVGHTVLLVRRTNLLLRIVANPSFREFMQESAAACPNPSVAELWNVVLTISRQFRLEFTRALSRANFAT